jgi:hypothetical protein
MWRAENPGVVCERICHLCIVINPPIVICNKISLLLSLLVFTLFIRVQIATFATLTYFLQFYFLYFSLNPNCPIHGKNNYVTLLITFVKNIKVLLYDP